MKRSVQIVLLVCAVASLVGCWDRRELNDLAITVGLGFDKQGDQILITAQTVNPDEVAGKQPSGIGVPTTVYTEAATRPTLASRSILREMPRQFYVSHLRIMAVGERLARDGVGSILDQMSRIEGFRSDFFIVIARNGTAETVLRKTTPPQELIPADKLFASFENASQLTAEVRPMTMFELIGDILDEGQEATVPGVVIVGPDRAENSETKQNIESMKPTSTLKLSGMAAFKKDKLVGWLDDEEVVGLNFITNKVKSTRGAVPCSGGHAVLETQRAKTKVTARFDQDKPAIHIRVQSREDLVDIDCDIDLKKTHVLEELADRREKDLTELLRRTVEKAQQALKSDIFGFGNTIRRADPQKWKRMRSDWDRHFTELPVNISVDVHIQDMGTTEQALPHEIREVGDT